jgi:hypothetical protein
MNLNNNNNNNNNLELEKLEELINELEIKENKEIKENDEILENFKNINEKINYYFKNKIFIEFKLLELFICKNYNLFKFWKIKNNICKMNKDIEEIQFFYYSKLIYFICRNEYNIFKNLIEIPNFKFLIEEFKFKILIKNEINLIKIKDLNDLEINNFLTI